MGGFDFDQGRASRDRRLRRAILEALYHSRGSPRGGLHGRPVVDVVAATAAPGAGFEGDAHAMQLVRDLIDKGLVKEEAVTRRRGQPFGPDYVFLRISDRGSMLCRGQADRDPDVDDDRDVGDA